MDRIKIAAAIILYYPDDQFNDNLSSVVKQVDKIFLVNNSESEIISVINSIPFHEKIECINFYKNRGIAAALNHTAELAIDNNFNFLLTLDQDSKLHPDLIKNFKHYIRNEDFTWIGILAPNYFYKDYLEKGKKDYDHSVRLSMTSGSLLNLDAYKKTGPFMDKLFIDYVDIEYCLRLRKKGFEIIKIHNANIYHSLGAIKGRKFLFRDISITNHSPLRLFYRTRNRFFVYKLYFLKFPGFVLRDIIILINELIKILFYEKNRFEKYKWVVKGGSAFFKNKMGKYETESNSNV
jgi:rhamnosyltransferase